ncbi:cupredoxin domain-containing protein [Paracoccus caeni]|uniref:Cupredoxin domain-containing protein n=1 Tax=Paracoccus caeni TaxID=657651 RepID=A0A934SLD1_9RHOB|nr:iron uptake system protein EfeO [Paracoccus caeni]MBK4216508.1 cupredoxin domain-containing protein [Paracoccus caeni]
MADRNPMSRGTAILALSAATFLVVAGGLALWLATRHAGEPVTEGAIRVTVNDRTCDPADLTVPAGQPTFLIHNGSNRTLEWEILDGVMVVAERENIVPGLDTTLSPRLKPGTYEITCGLLTNPRGTLTVTATAESEAARVKPELREFIGPLSEYRVYLSRRSSELVETTEALHDRIAAGDLEGAKEAWLAARQPWSQMAPIWPRIGDLTQRMDPLAAYLEQREEDPAFTGFHRIEYGLWEKGSTEGLQPLAQTLATDAETLKQRIREMQVAPEELAANASALAGRVADQLQGDHVSYAGADLAEYAADLDGAAKSALLIDPLVKDADAKVSEGLNAALTDARAALDGLKQGEAFPSWADLAEADRQKIGDAFRKVADAAAAYNPAIGLE